MKTTEPDGRLSGLDLRVEELEILVGPQHCAGDVTASQCDFYTAAGISASFISVTVVIT